MSCMMLGIHVAECMCFECASGDATYIITGYWVIVRIGSALAQPALRFPCAYMKRARVSCLLANGWALKPGPHVYGPTAKRAQGGQFRTVRRITSFGSTHYAVLSFAVGVLYFSKLSIVFVCLYLKYFCNSFSCYFFQILLISKSFSYSKTGQ